MTRGSPPLSTAYVFSGKSALCVSRWLVLSGWLYTPFISLNTTPLYVMASCGTAGSCLKCSAGHGQAVLYANNKVKNPLHGWSSSGQQQLKIFGGRTMDTLVTERKGLCYKIL